MVSDETMLQALLVLTVLLKLTYTGISGNEYGAR